MAELAIFDGYARERRSGWGRMVALAQFALDYRDFRRPAEFVADFQAFRRFLIEEPVYTTPEINARLRSEWSFLAVGALVAGGGAVALMFAPLPSMTVPAWLVFAWVQTVRAIYRR